ncbi:fatty-acyl-CoA synthase/long-chain acyl-CoA synthetase [Mycolicibacterium sp. BK556]|uniref:class I adenylate-forming enzyme family protein n=1 Tax=unclassified Mycolicibacterium TaxID=2636767 RepID=UPI001616BCD0|nr:MULTISPECIES: class I adenylate-forming enzyme family protein [unclassified Mycolicibacterium]MBB3606128.1 fatty-acyl-CoA synthase/long-chain acyl-CoA synthetase [Mycolicibacterium sp. BK556]MBB3632705.1 fatty-acyl-CoA synthase/long-chain acyl-CoA synthetase [Mycolicibacterium sp. BK607]
MTLGSASAYWTADRSTELVDLTVGELLAERAGGDPQRTALVGTRHGGTTPVRLTYGELFVEACRVATALGRLTDRGSHIALWAPNVVEWPIIQYGAALAGMVLVALSPVLPEDDLQYAVAHSGSTILLHADANRDYAMAEIATRVAGTIPGLRCISLSDHTMWCADVPDPAVLDDGVGGADEIAMLQYTSGTTGRPKGVALRHRSLVNVAKLTVEAAGLPDRPVCLNPLPMFHTAGCVIGTLGPLWAGGTIILVDRFAPAPVLAAMREEAVQVLFYVPAVLSALVDHQRASDLTAPRLEVIMGGASPVDPRLIDDASDLFGADVYNLYGQTELAPVLSLTRPTDGMEDRRHTVGRPLPQVDCKVTDPATGQVVATGEVGELCARGYQQFVRYLHDPEATAAAVDLDGFVHTGDLGAMDDRGYLTISGRLKELIIRGGENISPAHVERVLSEHDSVLDVVVVGLPDDRLGEIVAAVLRLADDGQDLKADLLEHAQSRLARYQVPARWYVTDQFPVTPTGKVQRFAVREAIVQGRISEL